MTAEPDGRSVLRLRFTCSELADWSQTDLRRLPLYLGKTPLPAAPSISG
ncbi:type VI secretion system baseplate subunit TssF [Klebsiella variicola subsp. variicola]|nr:type VI secretion system baseplate subunit TssF [Klebsiella variicola subsp. variicola]